MTLQTLLKYSALLGVLALLFVGFFHPLYALNQDLGRHIKTGEIILQTHSIPTTNLFSYTYANYPFVNHHWLWEVVFSAIHDLAGFGGVQIAALLLAVLAFAPLFISCMKKENSIALVFLSVLYLGVLFERTDIRPELFSFFFLSLFCLVLYSYKRRFTKFIFVLPLVELLWVNMHIYFIIGVAVVGLFFIDELVRTVLNRGKLLAGPRGAILFFVFVLTLLATLLNPNGIHGALYPFTVLQNYGYSIEENQNIFFLWDLFRKPTIFYFAISVVFVTLCALLVFPKTRLIDWLLLAFFTVLAAMQIRNFPLFVFGTFIAASYNLYLAYYTYFIPLAKKIPILDIACSLLVFGFLAFSAIQAVSIKSFGFAVPQDSQKAVDFFVQNNIKGPLFNNFDIGSFLEYRLFPKERVFVDGRPEAYPASFFQDTYIPMQNDPNVFATIDKQYNFTTIFFAHTDQTPWAGKFLKAIAKNPRWNIIFINDSILILVKDTPQNHQLIEKFHISQTSFTVPKDEISDKQVLLKYALLFNKIGWKDQEVNLYQTLLSQDPNSCFALYNLSVLLLQKKDPAGVIYLQKYNASCR